MVSARTEAGVRLGFYIGLLGFIVLLGDIGNSLAALAAAPPIATAPALTAVLAWAVGLAFVLEAYLAARREERASARS
ncbi:MAG: hypothetical protein A3K59_07600 [Euryarchaeota archaeon RBG_19FT_COMBO_69_17]|nr:MAG: hypothetical protein A3K59_07600 [Euryarchaeota archaeon RBG_19FT_COMBO_69_17]